VNELAVSRARANQERTSKQGLVSVDPQA